MAFSDLVQGFIDVQTQDAEQIGPILPPSG